MSRGTIAFSWGRYGGFYLHRHRICLGWVALTLLNEEIDDLMRMAVAGSVQPSQPAGGSEREVS